MKSTNAAADTNDRLRRLATYASVAVAGILIVTKLVAYMTTNSVAMLSALIDSTVDLLASLVTLFGVASARPQASLRLWQGRAACGFDPGRIHYRFVRVAGL